MEHTFFKKEQSKIKMVILTKGKNENKVWYSPTNQNKRRSELIIQSMLKRFARSKLFTQTNVVQFYENNVLIQQMKIV
jgi:hypothetical protein